MKNTGPDLEKIVDTLIKPISPDSVVMNAREVFPFQDNYDAVVAAAAQRPVAPDPELSHAANFLYMLRGERPMGLWSTLMPWSKYSMPTISSCAAGSSCAR